MKKHWIYVISIIVLFMVWFLLYLIIDHQLILPSPLHVFRKLTIMASTYKMYQIIFHTLLRLFLAISLSALIGIILAMLSYFHTQFKLLIKPYITILRTIPVISIVVILLIVLGFTWTPYVITFLMVFPIIYQGTLHGLESINHELIDVIKLEEKHVIIMIFGFYIPQIKSNIFLSFLQSFSLGLKVLVMAEYLAQTKNSIGNELYLAKVNLFYDEVFAWTIVLILIATLIELFIYQRMRHIHKQSVH